MLERNTEIATKTRQLILEGLSLDSLRAGKDVPATKTAEELWKLYPKGYDTEIIDIVLAGEGKVDTHEKGSKRWNLKIPSLEHGWVGIFGGMMLVICSMLAAEEEFHHLSYLAQESAKQEIIQICTNQSKELFCQPIIPAQTPQEVERNNQISRSLWTKQSELQRPYFLLNLEQYEAKRKASILNQPSSILGALGGSLAGLGILSIPGFFLQRKLARRKP